jgi:hypothetical protein
MEEEDWDFSRLFPMLLRLFATFCDFLRLNLQPLQALKGKSNPNQAYPKCNCGSSSSITQHKNPHTSLQTSKSQDKSSTIYAQNSSTLTLSHIAQIPQKQT